MPSVIELILSGLIISASCHFVWSRILNIRYKNSILKLLMSLIIMAFCGFVNYYFNNSYIKISSLMIAMILLIRIFYEKDLKKVIVATFLTEMMVIFSEFIFSIIMLSIFRDNLVAVMDKYFGALVTNIFVCSIMIFISRLPLLLKFYNKLLSITEKLKSKNIIFVVLILMVSVNIFLALPYYEISTLTVVIINAVMILVYSLIMFKFIEQKNRYIDISDKYSLTESSLKELQSNINRLMTVNHENKNQWLTIRTMVANKDKDVLKNIDAIIDRKVKDDKELKVRTSVISNTMLGALVYSKLLTMKENDINYSLHIDKALNKTDFINLGDKTNIDICKIVGVYLDNAIDAVKKIDNKEISVELYIDDEAIYITISNTFIGGISVDLINEYGYTTKEEGHGYGLALVREILKDNAFLTSETEIIDNIFVQKLKIKM